MKKRAISLVLVLLMVVLAFAGCAASETSAVVLKYLNAIKNDDTNAFLKCIDPDSANILQEQIGALDIDASKKSHMVKAMFGMGDEDTLSFKFLDEEVKEDTATVTMEVTFTRAEETETIEWPISVVKIDGKWYVPFG